MYVALPLTVLLALAQTTVMGNVALLGIRPNLLLLFAIAWVLLRGLREGVLIGLIGGIILDVSSAAPFGISVLSLTLGTSLAALGEINVFRGAWFLKFIVIAGSTVLFNLVMMLLLSIAGHGVSFWLGLSRILMPEVLIHAALIPLVYGLVKWLGTHMEPQTVEF